MLTNWLPHYLSQPKLTLSIVTKDARRILSGYLENDLLQEKCNDKCRAFCRMLTPIAKLVVFSSRFLCCGEDVPGAERSLPESLPTSEKIIARGTFEISNYCGAVK
jgi:hypothetical protein